MKKDYESCRFGTLNHWQRGGLAAAGASALARLTWFVLWGHADGRGVVRISFGRLAEESGLSKRSCQDKIRELITLGIIKQVSSGGPSKGANTYAIQVAPKKKKAMA